MIAFPKAALLVWSSSLRCMPLGVGTWSHLLVFLPDSMLIISSAPPVTSTLYWLLPSILYPMFMPWDRRLLLDVTFRAVAGTLNSRVKIATTQVPAVGALSLGFQRMLGMVRSKYLPGGLHGCEGAAISVSALASFRSAVARAVWSKKLPMTNTPALLSLLDGPWGSDPAFFIIWSRFRQLRRYLSYRLDEENRILRLLDFASIGSHGPIHLLIQSAEEIGFF